ncbi:hypothetical protein SAMN05216569_0265 [Pseudoxanthomonas sp. CF125]|nr:hypothetical protein SAMN05216569_0265 [Pseudoxanthomonas sp. CF125]
MTRCTAIIGCTRFLRFIFAAAVLAAVTDVAAQVHVKGYTRKDGTYVAPHVRSSPNSTTSDNYSTRGNYNPYTGKKGSINPNPVPAFAPYYVPTPLPYLGTRPTTLEESRAATTSDSASGQRSVESLDLRGGVVLTNRLAGLLALQEQLKIAIAAERSAIAAQQRRAVIADDAGGVWKCIGFDGVTHYLAYPRAGCEQLSPSRPSANAAPTTLSWQTSGTFGGYPCSVDCSGHEAGYQWANDNGITDPDDCTGNSQSFIEGCETWVDEQ